MGESANTLEGVNRSTQIVFQDASSGYTINSASAEVIGGQFCILNIYFQIGSSAAFESTILIPPGYRPRYNTLLFCSNDECSVLELTTSGTILVNPTRAVAGRYLISGVYTV